MAENETPTTEVERPRDAQGRFIPETPAEAAAEPGETVEAEKPDPVAALREEFNSELAKRDAEIARLRVPVQAGPTVLEKVPIYKKLATKVFENPEEAFKEFEEHIESKLTARYQSARSEDQFWDDFYRSNPDFDRAKDHFIIKAELNENIGSWQNLPVQTASEHLAKKAKARLLDIHKRYGPKAPDRDTTTLEGASSPRPKKQAESEQKVRKLSDVIRERQQQRSEAATKFYRSKESA